MKKHALLHLFIAISAFVSGQGNRLLDQHFFDVKSGRIEYKIDGKTKGTKTLWWDDFGRLQYEHTHTSTKLLGIATKEDKLVVRTTEWIYEINLLEKTGTKMKIEKIMEVPEAINASMSDQQLKQMGEDIMEGIDAKELSEETILGRSCQVMVVGKLNSKHWSYKKIPLKMEINMGGFLGISLEEAIKFDENISIPASQFTIPDGIEIIELGDFMNLGEINN
jgi:hypothetical protein